MPRLPCASCRCSRPPLRRGALALLLGAPLTVTAQSGSAGWRPLFDGRTLAGWTQCNGKATYTADNGTITGRAVLDSPNSFLCSTEQFGDFIFEFEFRQDSALAYNSGVQVRSAVDPTMRGGRVHGYQIDIDPTPRRWTGGIYDESRRGWLYTLENKLAAQALYRIGQWNRFRVEAIGSSIRVFVNGVPTADIIDDMTPRGIIALQVHDIGRDSTRVGQAVQFRNLRIRTTELASARTPVPQTVAQVNRVANTLTDREKSDGWQLLWDGRTTAGWRGAKLTTFPPQGWTIENGVLSVMQTEGKEAAAGGDIVTDAEYDSFELTLEYRLTRGANSGIKYFVNTALNMGAGSAIGNEFQVLDDDVHPDAKLGVAGNRTNGGLYDLIAPINRRPNPIGEWNQARIVVRGSHVEHWLNGFKTVEYERGTQLWRALVSHSKYKDWPNFGEATRGRILLQDHGNFVSYRSIKLRVLR